MLLRKYWIPLSVFIVAIVGVSFYVLQTRPPKDPILIVKPVEYEKQPAKALVVEQPEPVGHVHEDGTFHEEAHEPVEQQPTAEVSEPEPSPAYIYDPDATERPDGWDPELLFHTGHGKSIDLNYRPLTEEEQAEYERLKATDDPKVYGDQYEAGLRIVAIGNIKQKNSEFFLQSLWIQEDMGIITREEVRKKLRDYWEFFDN